MTDASSGTLRLWRLRKRHLYVDAELEAGPHASPFELRIRYGTTLTSSRSYASRAEAVAAARDRRTELEREGWSFHW